MLFAADDDRGHGPWPLSRPSQMRLRPTAAVAAIADPRENARPVLSQAIKSDLPRIAAPFHCADLCNVIQTNIGVQRTHL